MLGWESSLPSIRRPSLQPGHICDNALSRPTYEGLYGTVLCLACGYFGLGIHHPEWCSWEVLKGRPVVRTKALAIAELGARVAATLELQHPQTAPLSS